MCEGRKYAFFACNKMYSSNSFSLTKHVCFPKLSPDFFESIISNQFLFLEVVKYEIGTFFLFIDFAMF